MNFKIFENQVAGFDGLSVVERCDTHWQVLRDGKPVLDVWPTVNKWRRMGMGRTKATTGDPIQALELLVQDQPPKTNGHAVAPFDDERESGCLPADSDIADAAANAFKALIPLRRHYKSIERMLIAVGALYGVSLTVRGKQ